jgi:uncharacterized protein YndB with AHSA1/START domain
MKLKRSIDIGATQEKIWRFLVEPESIKKWCTPVTEIHYTGKLYGGLGTSFYFEEKAAGRMMKLNFVVTEWVMYRSVAFKMTSGNLVKNYEQRYTIESIPTGTRCTCFEDVKLPYGIIGRLAGLIRRFTSNGLLDGMLLNLKNAAEA